ncbi:hypothetical protein PF004_g8432 [Phytophthora fragariae]|uniref:Uncharacterized protein n=2 Tax=Phytophthora fragariae TaxID=53985 RepID=A0A6G0P6S1_9STRA|nr:hypothetical protein PF004_g8432 [Phytophthora fragariae]
MLEWVPFVKIPSFQVTVNATHSRRALDGVVDLTEGFSDLLRLGMFPKNMSDYHESDGVEFSCRKEDTGEFVCRAKRWVQEFDLNSGLAFACNFPDIDCSLRWRRSPAQRPGINPN